MNVDFIKLLKLLFPTFLRNGKIGAILTAIGTDLNALYAGFKTWQTDARLQAAITCQVMYMEAIINYRLFGNFNRTIYITDGDAVTVDFHVNITPVTTVNGQLLISLIEKYKLVGKRYDIIQSTVAYSAEWTDFVCELEELIYTAEWTGYVCELVPVLLNNLISIANDGLDAIVLSAQYNTPSRSTLIVTVRCNMSDSTHQLIQIQFNPTDINAYGSAFVNGDTIHILSATITNIAPSSDSNYNYTF